MTDELLGPDEWPVRPRELGALRTLAWLWLTDGWRRGRSPHWLVALIVGLPVRKRWRRCLGWRW